MQRSHNILLTGARTTIALDLARQFHAHGHNVFASDCNSQHICRYSNAIKNYYVTPSPRHQTKAFISTLIDIINKEQIDLLIPTCEEIMYISQHLDLFPKSCQVFCSSFDVIHELHSKWLFSQKVKKLNLSVPETALVRNQDELNHLPISPPFVLKAAYSRACQNCHFVTSDSSIPHVVFTPYNPWIAQKLIEGKKYCTYGLSHKGKLSAHVIYPVRFTMDGSSCITFEAIEHERIMNWIQQFLEATKFTGQIAFDFIEDKNGEIYVIECNPRATHGVHLFSAEDNLPNAFFNTTDQVITPKPGMRRQLGVGMAVFGWRSINRKQELPPFRKEFFNVQDVVFSKKDPGPFFAMSFLLPMYWVASKKYGISIAEAYTHDMEWNGDQLQASLE